MLGILIAGCARSIKPFEDIVPASQDITVNLKADPENEIKILYVTCGMLIIQKGEHGFLFDPYFSYQKMMAVPFALRTRKRFYEDFQKRMDATIDKRSISKGFVSHSHYDHLMDLPVLLSDHYFPNLKTIYGNEFVPAMMYHHQDRGAEIKSLTDDQVYNPLNKNDTLYSWIPISDAIHVLPIASMHAAHQFGVLAMSGKLNAKYFRKEKFKDPYARSKGFKWDGGCNYSFMVKFKNPDGSDFKLFIQTSGSNAPYGLPPNKEKADMAILCAASMQEVKDYPNYLVRELEAKKLILVHWEDFFRYPKNEDDVKMVRGTRQKLVQSRLKAIKESALKTEIIMPRPGTLITVKY